VVAREGPWASQRQAVRSWAERGRLAWLVGEGVVGAMELLARGEPAGGEAVVAYLERLLAESGSWGAWGRDSRWAAGRGRRQRADRGTAMTPWRDGERVLAGEHYPVLFVGAVRVRGAWATVALGVEAEGSKRVLGLWPGCTADVAVAEAAVMGLVRRGFGAERGLLVVHDGSQAVDGVVGRVWGRGAVLAHCPLAVEGEVLGHLAKGERGRWRSVLRRVWAEGGPQRAVRLRAVVEELGRRSPGAAARLGRSLGALCAVAELGLPARLARHVQGLGPVRELAEVARTAPGTGAAAIAAALPGWLARRRRLIGWAELPVLSRRLAERVGVRAAGA
jgi:hypothetical protein